MGVTLRTLLSVPGVLFLLSTGRVRAPSYNPPDDGLAEAPTALHPDPPVAGRDHRAHGDRRLRGVALAGPRADRREGGPAVTGDRALCRVDARGAQRIPAAAPGARDRSH